MPFMEVDTGLRPVWAGMRSVFSFRPVRTGLDRSVTLFLILTLSHKMTLHCQIETQLIDSNQLNKRKITPFFSDIFRVFFAVFTT